MHLSNLCMICLGWFFCLFLFGSVFYFCRMFLKIMLVSLWSKNNKHTVMALVVIPAPWTGYMHLTQIILGKLPESVVFNHYYFVHVPKYWILGIFFIRYVNSHWLCQSKTFHTHWSYMYTLTVTTTFPHSVFTWYQYTFTYICITITLFYWFTRPGPHLPVLGADNQNRPLVVRTAG